MTILDYDLLREERPDLKLPYYYNLRKNEADKLLVMSKEDVITARMASMLRKDVGRPALIRSI